MVWDFSSAEWLVGFRPPALYFCFRKSQTTEIPVESYFYGLLLMHRRFLLAALEKAWQGRGTCAPNPAVGAVLVHDDQIIASAWHAYAGGAHAEQRLLSELTHPVPPHSTLYVTLEPCNHWGKTPPCVDWIIRYQIERVVFAYRDVNPVVSNQDTPGILQAQGITVIHQPIDEIDRFYQSYAYWHQTGKPWVTAKIAQSLDGKIALPSGVPTAISNQACRILTHQLRRHCDVILTSAKTIIADNPRLNVRFDSQLPEVSKNIAILDRQLRLQGDELVFKYAKQVHLFYDGRNELIHPIEDCLYHPIATDNKDLNLNDVFEKLGALGYHDVFVEVGGRLFSALHHASVVNTSYFYIAPCILGPDAPYACDEGVWFSSPHQLEWLAYGDNRVMRVDWRV